MGTAQPSPVFLLFDSVSKPMSLRGGRSPRLGNLPVISMRDSHFRWMEAEDGHGPTDPAMTEKAEHINIPVHQGCHILRPAKSYGWPWYGPRNNLRIMIWWTKQITALFSGRWTYINYSSQLCQTFWTSSSSSMISIIFSISLTCSSLSSFW